MIQHMRSKRKRKEALGRSTDVQTAWSTYLRCLQSYFTAWRQRTDSVWLLTSKWICEECTALQISLGDILYLCHIPSRGKDADGCSLYWADGLIVITSPFFFFLPLPPFSLLSSILSFNFLRLSHSGRRQSSAMNHTMLWIKYNNTDLQPNTGIRKWWQQTNSSRWQKQRHSRELSVFDAYKNVHIQGESDEANTWARKKELKQTEEIKYFDIEHENNMNKKEEKQRSKSE